LQAEHEVLEFAEKLKGLSEPLSLAEIADKFGMDRSQVSELMWKLVKLGLVKAFFRENSKGELEAKYVVL
jgi:DNA-binding transcriptional regulator GbsR (MarR family)